MNAAVGVYNTTHFSNLSTKFTIPHISKFSLLIEISCKIRYPVLYMYIYNDIVRQIAATRTDIQMKERKQSDRRTNERTNERTDERTDGWTNEK